MTAAGTTSSVLEPPSNWHTESVLTPSTGIIHYQIRYPAGDAAFIMMCREAGGPDPGQGQPGPCPGSAGQVVRGPLPGQQRPSDAVDPLDRRARLRRRRQRGLHGRTDPGSQRLKINRIGCKPERNILGLSIFGNTKSCLDYYNFRD